MRYTEARLQAVAASMLQDLDEHIVDFVPNYSGTLREPAVLPAAIPNLLVNGSMGIAVGMATNIPPHNLGEAIRGCMAVIDRPKISIDELLAIIPAPDFPTGGRILTPKNDLKKIYETGRGAIDIQGDFEVEQDGKRNRIIVTSIPYAVNKSKIFEAIRELINANKLPQLVNVHDESTDDVRIVLDLKAGTDPNTVMAYLYKHTDLQSRFNVNMTCIVPGGVQASENGLVYQPKRLGLREIIDYFLNFRLEIVTKRLSWQLSQILDRIHILEGLKKLFDGLDEAIQIIREAEDRQDASQKLCDRFDLDDIQANAILELRLYKLARLEMNKITTELEAKQRDAKHIQTLLADEKKRWKIVRQELEFALKTYGDERRTQLSGVDLSKDYAPENYIVQEDCYVIITKAGLFKRQKTVTDVAAIRTKDSDAVAFVRFGSTISTLVMLSSLGKAFGRVFPVWRQYSGDDGARLAHCDGVSARRWRADHRGLYRRSDASRGRDQGGGQQEWRRAKVFDRLDDADADARRLGWRRNRTDDRRHQPNGASATDEHFGVYGGFDGEWSDLHAAGAGR